jgi:hypothetical protein
MLNFQPVRFRLPESFEGQKAWFVYETAVNLKATKAIGLDVPSLLRTRIGRLGVPVALEKEAEAFVAPVVAARNGDSDRRPGW